MFANINGNFLNPSHMSFDLHAMLKKANPPLIRFHDLRHTAASLLIKMKVNPKLVQEILGRSDVRMTLGIYSHVLPGMHEEAMEQMGQLTVSQE